MARELTPEEAGDLLAERILAALDGCDDDDVVRPAMVWAALEDVGWRNVSADELDGMTVGEMRAKMRAWRTALAEVEGLRSYGGAGS